MFSKAKRFEILDAKKQNKKIENKKDLKKAPEDVKQKLSNAATSNKYEIKSVCSSKSSVKLFETPKPCKSKEIVNVKKTTSKIISASKPKISKEILKSQEAEIRNKDFTILECNKHIEELKNEIANLRNQLNCTDYCRNDIDLLDEKLSNVILNDGSSSYNKDSGQEDLLVSELNLKIFNLESLCQKLEDEANHKQVELKNLEELIIIRDSLCKDLQEKLTSMETCLNETCQRLEMVKGHHALALEANESIRKEYKAELETAKSKFEDEKSAIINKSKTEQENCKNGYNLMLESLKEELIREKDEAVQQLNEKIAAKEREMKAKLEQINEATCEKIKLCEIQFEERNKGLQEHWTQQQNNIEHLKYKVNDLQNNLKSAEENYESLKIEKANLIKEIEDLKEEHRKNTTNCENEINRLVKEVDKVLNDKKKFETSLSVTRDIVQVLTIRLRDSDNEVENLENKVEKLTSSNKALDHELNTLKNSMNSSLIECQEYKEALVTILKSKAALSKEHTRIMEHNVTLIESLQNVEKEAYRELGTIKNDLIEDVEMLKKESNVQIQHLQDEVRKKTILCEMASEHAGQAAAVAEQSRTLLAQASSEIIRLENENQRAQQQIQDQQSLVVELSLLRQENEELSLIVAKQSSIIEQMKKDAENVQIISKASPIKKGRKIGKENMLLISPLRERNQ